MHILLRCDSSATLGLGHLKRCLLLAERLREADNSLYISFATQDLVGNINSEINAAGFTHYTLSSNRVEELSSLINKLNLKLLIIDSYDIDADFEQNIKNNYQHVKILSFDDMLRPHSADIVLNHGIQSTKEDYKHLLSDTTTLLCGSEYTLLRDEFFVKYNHIIIPKTIAIILGGNDVLNLSLQLAKLLLEIDTNFKIILITTSVNPNLKTLKENNTIETLVDIKNIAEVLASKELVITASGGTFFEVLALGKKFITIEVADNQKKVSEFLENKEIFTTIEAENITKEILEEKIKYINENDIYQKLDLHFSKDTLARKILEELR
ncbi:MAG: UDP-2,4-diacetamido-2,4,6-trideoxy-beta-L-altropyranose hydrolase [Sulfurimonadaceae bacterium]|jgi:UDP-2,4-diacetamido-2,4,6-trideoxy-beta-L-altropyranose hydrolase|nr:UDP-2,4-diacetamido-2,4,6-trideoxy-beta-L-altropyranose hydrolase [Sulfurimonadaceae bacterium]